jgi:hypothetical protein
VTAYADCWLRLPDPHGGDKVFLGYGYIDQTAGLSAKGVMLDWPATAATAAEAVDRPSYTIRLPGFEPTVLTDDEVSALGLPSRPDWADFFGPPPSERPWRSDPEMIAHAHADLADDFQATFYFWPEQRAEQMWVSLRTADPAIRGYAGQLLNDPHTPGVLERGATVSIRAAPGTSAPIWVSPIMRANLARWKVRCNDCGFDMLMAPADYIASQQFPEAPDGCVPVAFTTRCNLCDGTAMVETRV